MSKGIERETHNPKLPESQKYMADARNTVSIMEQAPVTIFIVIPLNSMDNFPEDWESRFYEVCSVQSIQNMLLSVINLGLGSLWNNNIHFAYEEIAEWLNTGEQIVSAVSFGVPAEKPIARPRRNIADSVEWR